MREERDDMVADLVRQIYFEKRRADRYLDSVSTLADQVEELRYEVADLRASRSELWRYALKDAARVDEVTRIAVQCNQAYDCPVWDDMGRPIG